MDKMRVLDGHYEMVEEGYTDPEPIIHVFGRDEHRIRRHFRVEGFHPYLVVPLDECMDKQSAINNDHRIRRIEWSEKDDSNVKSIDGKRLCKVITVAPYHVPKIRENFSEHYEADVIFFERFCIDKNIRDTIAVPEGVGLGEEPDLIRSSDFESVDESEFLDVSARVAYVDIEVAQSDDGPSVVSDTGIERAENPITAVTIADNYLDAYWTWVLRPRSWSKEDTDAAIGVADDVDVRADVSLHSSERTLLTQVIQYVEKYGPDVLTAWNASFDFPYLVNRLCTTDHPDRNKLSPTRRVSEMDGGGRFMNSDCKGRIIFDMLQGYEKTQIHELDSMKLEHVARVETDLTKLDVEDIDDARHNDPKLFTEYSIRDVRALKAIDESAGVLV